MTDADIMKIVRKACKPFPWGIGSTREIFLDAVRAILTERGKQEADKPCRFVRETGNQGYEVERCSTCGTHKGGTCAARHIASADDTKRIDYLERLRLAGIGKGYAWDTWGFSCSESKLSIREQLDAADRAS